MAAAAISTRVERQITWRDIFLTRIGIFSVLFILFGIWALVAAPANFSGDTITIFATDATTSANRIEFPIPTLGFLIVTGVLYIGGGILGLAGQVTQNPTLKRLASAALIIDGILIIPAVLVLVAANNDVNIVSLLA